MLQLRITSRLHCAKICTFFISTILLSTVVNAANNEPITVGDYTVHYNAFTSDSLQPAVAKAYGITRSKNRGLLSISILKKSLSPMGTPVKAKVSAEANNLTGQWKEIEVREVDDGGSVYYLSEFRVAHKELLTFKIQATPEGETKPIVFNFRQQFYTQ